MNSHSASPTASVAICIPTYNQAPYLAQAVRSARAQTYRDRAVQPPEIWVSDDASTDDTPRVVANLQAEMPSLQAFRQPENLGMSGNPRWVIGQPRTDYIVKLDSDDALHPDYVAALVAQLEAHPRAGYGHCAVEQIDESGRVTRVRRLARESGFHQADESLRAAVRGYRVAANICLFRRAALEAVDFYKTDMAFCDDWDLSIRLADAGWGNVYDARVLAQYRVWEDAEQVRPRRKLDEVEGCIRVYDEALAPAYARRNWDAGELKSQRRALALVHASVIDLPIFRPAERRRLTALLKKLGDSPPLRLRLRLMRMGYGPILRARRAAENLARDRAKALLGTANGARRGAPDETDAPTS